MEHLTLGLAVQTLREANNLSAKELSLMAGLPDYTVRRIEDGSMRLDFSTTVAITSAMGVTIDELAERAKALAPSGVIEKTEELEKVREQLRALKSTLLTQTTLR